MMSATRPLIAALGTSIFWPDVQLPTISSPGEGLLNPNPVVTNQWGDLTPSPQWTPGWQLGEPDLIVTLSTPYSLPLEGSDVFRNFVIPNVTASDRYVRALELRLETAMSFITPSFDSTRVTPRGDAITRNLDPASGAWTILRLTFPTAIS